MTIDEVIRRLENISDHAVHTIGEESFTMSLDDGIAVKIAIKSLEAWEVVKAEIEKESNIASNMLHWGEAMGLNMALEIIDKHLAELRGETDETN